MNKGAVSVPWAKNCKSKISRHRCSKMGKRKNESNSGEGKGKGKRRKGQAAWTSSEQLRLQDLAKKAPLKFNQPPRPEREAKIKFKNAAKCKVNEFIPCYRDGNPLQILLESHIKMFQCGKTYKLSTNGKWEVLTSRPKPNDGRLMPPRVLKACRRSGFQRSESNQAKGTIPKVN